MDTRWADGNVKRGRSAIGANIVRLRQSHLDSAGDSQTGSHDQASRNDAVGMRSCASRFKVAGGGAELLRGTVLRRSSPHRLSSLDSNTQEHIPAGLWGVKSERPEECETAPLSSRPYPSSRRSSGRTDSLFCPITVPSLSHLLLTHRLCTAHSMTKRFAPARGIHQNRAHRSSQDSSNI